MAACGDYFDIATFGVFHPPAQAQRRCFAMHKPAKADALNSSLNKKSSNHKNSLRNEDPMQDRCQCCRCLGTMQAAEVSL